MDGSDSERRYYHTGHLGSIRAVTDEGGQVVERKDFYPFGLQMPGRTLTQGPRADEDFTGYEKDEETQLLYAGARYYMPALGRWGAPDPHADAYPRHTPYNYALNNPLLLIDPDGKDAVVTINDSTQTVTISATINLRGEEATEEYASQVSESISSRWGEKTVAIDGNEYSVETDIEVNVWEGSEAEWDQAIMEAGNDRMNSNNFITVKTGRNAAGTGVPGEVVRGISNSYTGEFSSEMESESMAHEFGHLLGLPEAKNVGDPGYGNPPARGGIMSYARNRSVMNEEVQSALETPISGHELKKAVMWGRDVQTIHHIGGRIVH